MDTDAWLVELSRSVDVVLGDPVSAYQHFVNVFVFTNESGQQDTVEKAPAF